MIRTFIYLAHQDRSLPERLRRATSDDEQHKDERELEGFFGKVVFTCGALNDGDLVRIYYGAADGVVAVADLSLAEIISGLVEA